MSRSGKPIQNDYVRLPGSKWAEGWGMGRAYLGPNHLLTIRPRGMHEFARRFYYDDITALHCHKTPRGVWIGLITFLCAMAPWSFLAFPALPAGPTIALAIACTAVFGALFTLNAIRGTTCETWLHTANHAERLTSLSRYRSAHKALGLIHSRIQSVQRPTEGLDNTGEMPALHRSPVERPRFDATPAYQNWRIVLRTAFLVDLVSTFMGGLSMVVDLEGGDIVEIGVMFLVAILMPWGLAVSRHAVCTRAARFCAWTVMTVNVAIIPVSLLLLMGLAILGADVDAVDDLANMSPGDGAAYYMVLITDGLLTILGTCFGIGGLLALRDRSGKEPRHSSD